MWVRRCVYLPASCPFVMYTSAGHFVKQFPCTPSCPPPPTRPRAGPKFSGTLRFPRPSIPFSVLPWEEGSRGVSASRGCFGRRRRSRNGCFLVLSSSGELQGEGKKPSSWSWFPGGRKGPESLLRLIAGATSSPICQFIDSPATFLHSVDPRIKLVWLLALVIVPARSTIYMRACIAMFLSILTICILPARIWRDQLKRVYFLSGILFLLLGLGSDSAPPLVQTRLPPSLITGLPDIPSSFGGYSYLIMKLGPLQLTRKGLSVASMSSCLTFTILQSASLCLATTTPEQLAASLQWFMHPLTLIGVPVGEIILTLLLSLRFINLVFDEVRNTALGIVARRIRWQQLTGMETLDIFFTYIWRIFKNIFTHAEQISQAMIVRGFRGNSESHRIYLFSKPSKMLADIISLSCLAALVVAAILFERIRF